MSFTNCLFNFFNYRNRNFLEVENKIILWCLLQLIKRSKWRKKSLMEKKKLMEKKNSGDGLRFFWCKWGWGFNKKENKKNPFYNQLWWTKKQTNVRKEKKYIKIMKRETKKMKEWLVIKKQKNRAMMIKWDTDMKKERIFKTKRDQKQNKRVLKRWWKESQKLLVDFRSLHRLMFRFDCCPKSSFRERTNTEFDSKRKTEFWKRQRDRKTECGSKK